MFTRIKPTNSKKKKYLKKFLDYTRKKKIWTFQKPLLDIIFFNHWNLEVVRIFFKTPWDQSENDFDIKFDFVRPRIKIIELAIK